MKKTIIFIYLICTYAAYGQSKMTPKEAFYYALRVNNTSPNNTIEFKNFGNIGGKSFQWVDFYASTTDEIRYINAINDEFKKNTYLTQVYNEMISGISNLQFKKQFYLTGKVTLGTYNQDFACFPLNKNNWQSILLSIKKVGKSELMLGGSFLDIRIEDFTNRDNFSSTLNVNASVAEQLINSRKDSYGNVNRDVLVKVIYSILDLPTQNRGNTYLIRATIHRIEYYNGSQLLGALFPKDENFSKLKLRNAKDSIVGQFSEGLARIKWGDKVGYINNNEELVVPAKYDAGGDFVEGVAYVHLGNKVGFIDRLGNIVLPFKYDDSYGFSEGLASVGLDRKNGFINKAGEVVIPLKYDMVYSFSEGLAAVNIGLVWGPDGMSGGKWGFIDKTGKEIIPLKYDEVSWGFQNGKVEVKLNGRSFNIDKTGVEVR